MPITVALMVASKYFDESLGWGVNGLFSVIFQIPKPLLGAMELEFLAAGSMSRVADPGSGAVAGPPEDSRVIDWAPWLREMIDGMEMGTPRGELAAGFHQNLVSAAVGVATRCGLEPVALSGGCFQNRLLLEGTVRELRAAGFRPVWHQRVPPNDGGVALGQAVAGSLRGF